MNSVNLTGRISKKFDLRTVGTGEKQFDVLDFTLAVKHPYRKDKEGRYESMFMPCRATRGLARVINEYYGVGDLVEAECWLEYQNVKKDDGTYVSYVHLNVDKLNKLASSQRPAATAEKKEQASEEDGDLPIVNLEITQDDLPF